mgnify:CR=1 FL=1
MKKADAAVPKMTYGAATRKARRLMKVGGATPAQVDMIMKMIGKKAAPKKMYGSATKPKMRYGSMTPKKRKKKK